MANFYFPVMAVFAAQLVTASVALAADDLSHGADLFTEKCAVCHQADGAGAPGLAPPLAGALGGYVKTEAGQKYLSNLLVVGMNGPIESLGKKYNGVMPPWGALSDKDVEAVLRYVLVKFNGVTSGAQSLIPTADTIAKARGSGATPPQVREMRGKAREGQ